MKTSNLYYVAALASSLCCHATSDYLFLKESEISYPNGTISYTTRQKDNVSIVGYEDVSFSSLIGRDTWGACIHVSNEASDSGIEKNKTVLFSKNEVWGSVGNSVKGGCVCASNAFSISNNENVDFSENLLSAFSSGGGAIYSTGVFNMNNNDVIGFYKNKLSASFSNRADGGAISMSGLSFSLVNNGEIYFDGNSASTTNSQTNASSYGGAVYAGSGDFELSNNRLVSLKNNYAKSSALNAPSAFSQGGAIKASYGNFIISGNDELCFENNSAHSVWEISHTVESYSYGSAYSKGGAIYNECNANFEISDNGLITFEQNSARSESNYVISKTNALGGAIFNEGILTIKNNDSIVFRKNYEVRSAVYSSQSPLYRLRSIYSTGTLNMSASEEGSISFFDSVYASGEVRLNENGTGNIVFSGATTEDDLQALSGGRGVTTEEINNSRHSSLLTDVNLAGGCLSVQNKAELTVNGLSSHSTASLEVKDAAFKLASGNVSVASADSGIIASLRGISLHDTSVVGEDAEHIGFISGTAMSISNAATLSVKYVELDATTQFNSAATTLAMTDVTSQMAKGVNTTLVGEDTVLSDTMLVRSGNSTETLTMSAGATVLQLENSAFDAKALQGDTLHLILSGYTMEEIQARDYLVISFKNSAAYASLDKDLAVSLQIAGVEGAVTITGWYLASDVQNGGAATALYFETAKMPEPASATLSLLALAALATRRKRK